MKAIGYLAEGAGPLQRAELRLSQEEVEAACQRYVESLGARVQGQGRLVLRPAASTQRDTGLEHDSAAIALAEFLLEKPVAVEFVVGLDISERDKP